MSARPQIVPPAGIAVIGLGNMGVPMGARLVRAGYGVTGFDPSAAARERFVAAGGRTAGDIASAVAAAELVVTLLPNGRIVREAIDSLRPHLRPSAIIAETFPLGPSTRTVLPCMVYFTPAGSGIGFFPIRDIASILFWLASPEKQLPVISCQ